MKKLLVFLLILSTGSVTAQERHFTKSGKISFDATTSTSPEKIAATTNTAICVLEKGSGKIQFSVALKSFEFANALMQEHFNENYVESHKFPKAEFRGQILQPEKINYQQNVINKVTVKGTMLLHGAQKEIESNGTITIQNGKIILSSTFVLLLKDFGIKIPGLVSDKVGEQVKISLEATLDPLNK